MKWFDHQTVPRSRAPITQWRPAISQKNVKPNFTENSNYGIGKKSWRGKTLWNVPRRAIYETTLFRNPKDHHLVSMRSHVQQESKKERSENKRWEFLTSHVCRHFCKHTRYVKPVYWRTRNVHADVHEPYKIKSMKRRRIKTSKIFIMLSTSKEASEFSLGLYVFFFFYLLAAVFNDFNADIQQTPKIRE
jgi:hypothetical protein